MEFISHAAILRTDKCLIFDRDHARCILRSPFGTCKENSMKGFITNELRFVNRYEAAIIAFQAKQIDNWEPGQVLISEELWSLESGGKHLYCEASGYYLRPKGD